MVCENSRSQIFLGGKNLNDVIAEVIIGFRILCLWNKTKKKKFNKTEKT